MLDRDFDATALGGLREAVLVCATAAGMPRDRALDVMLTVHELAANAVRHGAGHGRVTIRLDAGALRCEVSDAGPAGRDGIAPAAEPWPVELGHGLWLVGKAADQFHATSGPDGTLVTVVFTVPAQVKPARQPARQEESARGPGGRARG